MQSVLLIIVALPKQFKSWLHLASAHIRNMGISLSKPTSCQSKGTQTQMDVEYSDDTHIPLRNRQSKFCSAITISASHHCSIRVSMDLAYLAEMRKISDPTSLPFFLRCARSAHVEGMNQGSFIKRRNIGILLQPTRKGNIFARRMKLQKAFICRSSKFGDSFRFSILHKEIAFLRCFGCVHQIS